MGFRVLRVLPYLFCHPHKYVFLCHTDNQNKFRQCFGEMGETLDAFTQPAGTGRGIGMTERSRDCVRL